MAVRYIFVVAFLIYGFWYIFPQNEAGETSIEKLTEEIRRNPNDAGLYEERGYYLKKAGKLREAKNDLDAALALDPQKAYSNYLRGNIYLETESYAEALKDLNMAVSLNPGEKEYYFTRGIAHILLKNFDAALDDMDYCIKNKSPGGLPYFFKALIYFRTGKYQESLRNINIAIGIEPEAFQSYEFRMQLNLFCLLRPQEAMADINRILSLGADRDIVYFCRAYIYLTNREYDRAFEDIEIYINRTRGNESVNLLRAEAYSVRGTIYSIRKEYRKAIEDRDTALKVDPDANIYSGRGTTYLFMAEQEKDPVLRREYRRKGEEDMRKAKERYRDPDPKLIDLLSRHWDRQQLYDAAKFPLYF
jgi:tetratricopeptide (TPR) repeat protein